MDLGLKGKRAIVTGATRGIGRAIADTLAAEGAQVAICARKANELDDAVAALRAQGVAAYGAVVDIADGDALKAWVGQAAAQMGGLDILVCNASALVQGNSEEAWSGMFGVDVMGVQRVGERGEAAAGHAGDHVDLVEEPRAPSADLDLGAPQFLEHAERERRRARAAAGEREDDDGSRIVARPFGPGVVAVAGRTIELRERGVHRARGRAAREHDRGGDGEERRNGPAQHAWRATSVPDRRIISAGTPVRRRAPRDRAGQRASSAPAAPPSAACARRAAAA